MLVEVDVGREVFSAYQGLVSAEARLGESLASRGAVVNSSIVDRWPVLHEYLSLYARALSPAGVLVFGGAPDEGSRYTGIPFTGAREARAHLGLSVRGVSSSPAGDAFWRAVLDAQAVAEMAPLESLFSTVHLAHARPFDAEPSGDVREASARYVVQMVRDARPQVVVAVGADALATLGHALGHATLLELASADESTWVAHYPPGTRIINYPTLDIPGPAPFRTRVVPVPSFTGDSRREAAASMTHLLSAFWP